MPHALPPEITIYTLTALRREWQAWLPRARKGRSSATTGLTPWPVDASAVVEVDAAGVQLVLSLAHSLSTRGKVLQLEAPSQTLSAACLALGMGHLLSAASQSGAVA